MGLTLLVVGEGGEHHHRETRRGTVERRLELNQRLIAGGRNHREMLGGNVELCETLATVSVSVKKTGSVARSTVLR